MNETAREVPYEILFSMNYMFLYCFILLEIVMGIIKAWNTNYPSDALLSESCIFILMILIEFLRIYFGRRGNMVVQKFPVFCSILLTVPSATGIYYFMFHQIYILRLEYICGIVLLIFQVIALVYGIKFLVTVCKKPT